MAKNYFLLVLLLTASVSHAQIKIGIMGGPQSASITEKNSIPDWDSTTGKYYSNKSGIHLGVMAEIPLGKRIYFEPALLYSEKGRNFSKNTQSYVLDSINQRDTANTTLTTQNLTIQYIDIPLNFAYKQPLSRKKNISFLLSAGPYLTFFFNGKSVFNQRSTTTYKNYKQIPLDSFQNTIVTNKSNELEIGKKDNSYKTFGYGINARAGFELGNVTITGFYSQGLDNLYYATYSGTFKHKVYGASLGIWLGQVKEAVTIKDKDKDGITDDKDACPLLPGAAITNGCPDKDGDGIADIKDRCADTAGVAKYQGCPVPDTDHDGINDEVDKCPSVAGLARYQGCPVPDTDNDGVNDEEDKCRTVAGLAKYDGCPIPDTDNDGVNDEADKCPAVAGTADNNGCPVVKEDIKKQVDFAAQNIFFLTNSSELLSKSFKPLQTVADVLKANPELKLQVDGYTDNTGSEAANLAMSAKRALAVSTYLIRNGIDAVRITTHGYGSTQPLADNKTAAGRTKNRRVELKVK